MKSFKINSLLLIIFVIGLGLSSCSKDDDDSGYVEIAYNQNLIGNWTRETSSQIVSYSFYKNGTGKVTYEWKATGDLSYDNIKWEYTTGAHTIYITFLYDDVQRTYTFTIGNGYIADPDDSKFYKE